MKKQMLFCFAKVITIICVCISLVMIFSIFDPSLKVAINPKFCKDISPAEAYENNKELFTNLQEEIWVTLSIKEKINVLQHVAYVEERLLGLPFTPLVEAADLETNTLASYLYNSRTIQISKYTLESLSPMEAVKCICHECYHAYEYCLIEIYENIGNEYKDLEIFKKARMYYSEFTFQKDFPQDITEYLAQENEIDARNYAAGAAMIYFVNLGHIS